MLRLHVITARMRHGTQGHMAEPCEPTRRLGGAEEARTSGRGPASPYRRPGGAMWQVRGLAVDGWYHVIYTQIYMIINANKGINYSKCMRIIIF